MSLLPSRSIQLCSAPETLLDNWRRLMFLIGAIAFFLLQSSFLLKIATDLMAIAKPDKQYCPSHG
jgi:hypothetical protein